MSGSPRPRVLVIDDDVMLVEVLKLVLGRDLDVQTATSASDAVRLLAGGEWELVLCDLRLDGLSGVAIHDWLLANRPRDAGRFVLMSGDTFDPIASELAVRRGVRCLQKPFPFARVRELLECDLVAGSAGASR